MRRLTILLLIFLAVTLASCAGEEQTVPVIKTDKPGEFVIAGSGSNLPITGKLLEYYLEYYNEGNDEKIKMPNSIGSGGAVMALMDQAVDLGLTSRPLKDAEKAQGLKEIPYARVGIVIGVHPAVPDDSISYQELVAIFAGKKTLWQNGNMIIVFSREPGDSTNDVLTEKVPGFDKVLEKSFQEKRWQISYTDAEEAANIADTPNSLGFTDTGALTAWKIPIKALAVNGVPPAKEKMLDGSYPLTKDLYFIYRGELSMKARDFLDFVFSAQGAEIIAANGGIPLERR